MESYRCSLLGADKLRYIIVEHAGEATHNFRAVELNKFKKTKTDWTNRRKGSTTSCVRYTKKLTVSLARSTRVRHWPSVRDKNVRAYRGRNQIGVLHIYSIQTSSCDNCSVRVPVLNSWILRKHSRTARVSGYYLTIISNRRSYFHRADRSCR